MTESLSLKGEWVSGMASPTIYHRKNRGFLGDDTIGVRIDQLSVVITPDISLYNANAQTIETVFEYRIDAKHPHSTISTEVAILTIKRNPSSPGGVVSYPIFPTIKEEFAIKTAVYNTGSNTEMYPLNCDEIYYVSLYISTVTGYYFVVADDRRVVHTPTEVLVPFEVQCPDREKFRPTYNDQRSAFSRSLHFNEERMNVGMREQNNVLLLHTLPFEMQDVYLRKPGPPVTLSYSHTTENPYALEVEAAPWIAGSGLVFDVSVYANAPMMGPPLVSLLFDGDNMTYPEMTSVIMPSLECDALTLPESETFVCVRMIDSQTNREYFYMRDVWHGLNGMEHVSTLQGGRPCLRIPHKCDIWDSSVDLSAYYENLTVAPFAENVFLARTDSLQNVAFFVEPFEVPLRKMKLKTSIEGNLNTNVLSVMIEMEHMQFVPTLHYPLDMEIRVSVAGCPELDDSTENEVMLKKILFRVASDMSGTMSGSAQLKIPAWIVGYPVFVSVALRSGFTKEVILTQTAGSYTHFSSSGTCIAYRFGTPEDQIGFPFPLPPTPSTIPSPTPVIPEVSPSPQMASMIPSPTPVFDDKNKTHVKTGVMSIELTTPVIIGIVIAAVVFFAAIATAIFCVVRKNRPSVISHELETRL